jgi:hypothetical protein
MDNSTVYTYNGVKKIEVGGRVRVWGEVDVDISGGIFGGFTIGV